MGRGNHKNILIAEPANSVKTFMLKPLQNLFGGNLLNNTANDKFGWFRDQRVTCMLFNDFRRSNELKLPVPKNFFSENICISSDIPIFATSKSMIKFCKPYNTTDDMEDDIMKDKWRAFGCSHVFPGEDYKKVLAWRKCFCNLIVFQGPIQ